MLVDYGLSDKVVEKLLDASVGTIERLGSMTPEQLEEIQGIGPKMVEHIQEAVNAYYSQFESGGEEAGEAAVEAVAEEVLVVEEVVISEGEAPAEESPSEGLESAPADETEQLESDESVELSGTMEDAQGPHGTTRIPEEGRGN